MKDNNKKYNILIVDDEMLNIELAAVYLKEEGYNVLYATDALNAIENVSKKEINLILLDINMPGKNGFDVCKILKEDTKTKDIPIIFLTAQTDIAYIHKAFEAGGVDYITKPFNGVELKSRVKTHLQTINYIEEIKDKQSKLALFSITDPLTKLHNSLYFDTQINKFQKKDKDFWFITLKIDRLDKINKIYGFYGANTIIKEFAKVLEKESVSTGVISRLYGANFSILLKNYDQKSIRELYKNIVLKVSKNEKLKNTITFSTVLYDVKKANTSLTQLYKTVQDAMEKLEDDSEHKYLFI